jgi:threonine/homoserine/homoserine lactone efflux protein
MGLLKYRTVQLFLAAIIMALVAIPFSEYDNIFLTLRMASFAILMYLLIKFTSGKKKVKKIKNK